MASTLEFVQFLSDQLSPCGCVTYRKLFGDYCIYLDGCVLGLVCDDVFYFANTEKGRSFAPDLPEGYPFEGAKLHQYIEDVEDSETLCAYVNHVRDELRPPKKKSRKKKSEL